MTPNAQPQQLTVNDDDGAPLTPNELAEVHRKTDKAKSLLIVEHPFFGMAVLKRSLIWTYDIPTASMAGTGQMRLNPRFVSTLSVRQIMFLLAHEAMHYMLMHSFRRGWRDAEQWNIAADYLVNDMLLHGGPNETSVGDFIDGGLIYDGAREFAAEQLYSDPPEGGTGGDEPEDNDGDGDGGSGSKPKWGIGQDIGPETDDKGVPLDDSQKKEIEAKTKVELIQTSKQAKAIGKLPASIQRIVDEIVNVKTPWYDILMPHWMSKIPDGISWQRPNRRHVANGLYLPGVENVPKMGVAVLGIDTSMSITDKELAVYSGHFNRILETCNPEKLYVIYCDADVNHVDEFAPEDYPVKLEMHGGGGTRFRPVFDYIDEHDLDPEVVVYMTDGDGDQNHFTSTYDTVWLTTRNTNFSWGRVIEFDINAE